LFKGRKGFFQGAFYGLSSKGLVSGKATPSRDEAIFFFKRGHNYGVDETMFFDRLGKFKDVPGVLSSTVFDYDIFEREFESFHFLSF
jgi:uncharacterized membrane protein